MRFEIIPGATFYRAVSERKSGDGIRGCNHTAIFRYLARAPALFLDPSKPTLELENTHFIPHLIALG